jgi:ubiquinone/menaquinone biosynthesis C-methylase UbiE
LTTLNDRVRSFWEVAPCGTNIPEVRDLQTHSREWFDEVERFRYSQEPFIHAVAQFTCHRGKKILEVGVGAGTDHLQWARAGARCYGVDLTDAAIETTAKRLEVYGFSSNLQRIDAERLPFPDASFDLVYSWGVIHHSEVPAQIVGEIHRVLRPGGMFVGMMYARRSLTALRVWLRHGLVTGRPWRSFSEVLWHHMESLGTKAYTVSELRTMFARFSSTEFEKYLTPYDTRRWPAWTHWLLPDWLGWFIAIRAVK